MAGGAGALAWADGRFVAPGEALFDAFATDLLHGFHVFESFRLVAGRVAALELHLARLRWAAGRLGLDPVPAHPYGELLAELAARAGLREARARLLLFGPGMRPRIVLSAAPPAPAPRAGLALAVAALRRDPRDPTISVKCGSRAFLRLCEAQARAAGADDALLLGPDGRLLETTRANLFFVDAGGCLCTPTICDAFLPGITRLRLLRAARARGLAVREGTFFPADLAAAREVFATNAVQGIVPVRRIGARRYPVEGVRERWLHVLGGAGRGPVPGRGPAAGSGDGPAPAAAGP